jgi:GT2 family glycosyltransferase
LRASVVIVNHNGWKDLEGCLDSLVREALLDWEIIVVDNASTDGSVEYVGRTFPEVRVVCNGTNKGFGHGNNVGVRLARGEKLVFLNPDTVVEPGWLEPLLAALETNPDAGLVTAKILILDDPNRINACGNDIHITGLSLCCGMGRERTAHTAVMEVSGISGAAFAMRRELFEVLGGFDERFFLYMEDTDLSWRARLAGYRCLCVPQSVVKHDYYLRFGPRKTYYQERNRYLMLLKNLRWGTLLVLLPALALAEVVTWGFVLLRERQRLSNKLEAYAWIARNWGEVMESRRQTQALRRVGDRALLAATCDRLDFQQTGPGPAARLAAMVFNPLFLLLRRLALAVIRW